MADSSHALITLGITRWLPRRRLPGARPGPAWQREAVQPPQSEESAQPSRAREISRRETAPARPAPRAGQQRTERPKRPVATGHELHYCAVLRPLSQGWFLLSEGDPVAGSAAASLFLQDMLHAIGLDASTIGDARRLDWPPPGGERLATDPVMGREALQAFVQSTDTAQILCVSTRIGELLGTQRPNLIATPDLSTLLTDAAARRDAWQILARINERKS